MTISVQTLSKLSIFSGLNPQTLQEVASYLHERTLQPGDVLVWESDPCEAVFFVVHGLARMRRMSPEGREQTLGYLSPGDSINLVPALDGGNNPSTVEALTETTLYTLSCGQFHLILYDHQEVSQAVLKLLAQEVRRLNDLVEELALHTVRTRLARFLLVHLEGATPPKGWTQEEIAARIGTVREMVGRTLRAFAEEGFIARSHGRIVVIDRAGLEREASGQ